ncbi:MAG: glycosyltransferase [Thermoleophilia bacterium]
MKVLHVNNVDLHGRRFNGYDLLDDIERRGHCARQAVLTKQSDDPRVVCLADEPQDEDLQQALCRIEQRRAMSNLLFPWGRRLAQTNLFRSADVVHYHLLHNQMVSLLDLPELCQRKPSVWTMHDPWPCTGHCLQPGDCSKWLNGCDPCAYPEIPFAIGEGGAERMWRVKKSVFAEVDVDIVVASAFMHDMVRRSPLTAQFQRVHHIPFGIDADTFLSDAERPVSRASLGVRLDDFVVLVRASANEIKGLRYLIQALSDRTPARSTTILALDEKGLLNDVVGYTVVELGWVDDPARLARAYNACDVFVMPSTAEAFGLMALEALAAGRPTLSFIGTVIPALTRAPECGIAVPMGDSVKLREALDHFSHDSRDLRRRSEYARAIAHRQHKHATYVDTLLALYADVAGRSRS